MQRRKGGMGAAEIRAARTHLRWTWWRRSQQWVDFPIPRSAVTGLRFHCDLPTKVWVRGSIDGWDIRDEVPYVSLFVPTELVWRMYVLGSTLRWLPPVLKDRVAGCAGVARYRDPERWVVSFEPSTDFELIDLPDTQ